MSKSAVPEARLPIWAPERRPWGWGDALALGCWTAAVAIVFREALFLRGALFYFDISEINYPYRDFLAGEMRSGRFARWHPGLYCGFPLYSESQAGYWHPLKYALYPWLETWKAFNLDTVLSVWLAGLGAYGWLRRHVGAAGALAGAGLFAMGGFTWAHLIHTSMTNALISVPLAFWALECTWEGGRLRGVALGGLAIACQVFAGHLQDTLLTGSALGVYGLHRAATARGGWRERAFALGATGWLLGLGVAVAAVQWVPSKELLDRSPRAGGLSWEDQTYGSWHPELLPTLLVREAYGTRARDTDWMDGFYPYHEMNAYLGVVGLALAAIGAAAYCDRWAGFWLILGGLGALLMLGRFTFLFDHMRSVPVVGSTRIPVRYHLWVTLAVAALAAVGVDRLSKPGRVRLGGAVGLVTVMALVSAAIAFHVYGPLQERSFPDVRTGWLAVEATWAVLRTLAIALLAWVVAARALRSSGTARRRYAALLPLLAIADLIGAHWHEAPTIAAAYWTVPPPALARIKADPSVQRVLGEGVKSSGEPGYASKPVDFFAVRDTLAWSLAPVWGLPSSRGETPIHSRRLSRYMANAPTGRGRYDIEGVSHFLTAQPRIGGDPRRAGTAFLLRNPRVLPRARLAGRPIYVADEREAVAALRQSDSRTSLIIEDPSRPLPEDADASGRATIEVDQPERVEVATESASASYLFLADTFDPGWSATLDGRAAPIRPAVVAFRAVFVPAGSHRVVFTYRPAGFALGLGFTAAGLVATAVLLAWPRRVAAVGPAHGDAGWPRGWPWWFAALFLAVIAASAVRIGPDWRVQPHPRWSSSIHRFNWNSGIESIKTARPPAD